MTPEGGFAAAAALMEMLLQSYGGVIRLFPGVPPAWRNARFAGLRAEGAFLVSAQLSDGAVAEEKIVSEKGVPCRIQNPFSGKQVVLEEMGNRKMVRMRGTVLEFATMPGGVYRLTM